MLPIWQQMNKVLIQEDKYWMQQVETHWYQIGDLNTKNLQVWATMRKKVSCIISLEIDGETILTDDTCMFPLSIEYFEDLFHGQYIVYNRVIDGLTPVVDENDNMELMTLIHIHEFK
jgi:hypothetical protein